MASTRLRRWVVDDAGQREALAIGDYFVEGPVTEDVDVRRGAGGVAKPPPPLHDRLPRVARSPVGLTSSSEPVSRLRRSTSPAPTRRPARAHPEVADSRIVPNFLICSGPESRPRVMTGDRNRADCLPCTNNARVGSLPPHEEIEVRGVWRMAHAFGTSLPGWLVVIPTRHVEALDELEPSEAAQLGDILHRTVNGAPRGCRLREGVFRVLRRARGLLAPPRPRDSSHGVVRRGATRARRVLVPGSIHAEEAWLSDAEYDRIALAVRGALPSG